ncbi:hypothetical protein CFC21_084608 [Triticum aestivum]|uniref:Uncharacterized protein n=3 Tax=Triticum TaxID=4564 RepID=A0A9R1KP39_WHEAT|nr:hypothetical protein CFC21_067922 [Triticum aestivum]KAF7080547.1 hypothetical protein CFC21_084608 [Triticum aestivum]VAI22580.1 unnamed protein product [Triticum turgidum subsp. durum]VAI49748.1 unnamed protein product [Triticum turgidum subsp. durum]
MNLFLGFRREHVPWNFKKTENHVYLHVVLWQKLDADESEPAEEATLLTIVSSTMNMVYGVLTSMPSIATFADFDSFGVAPICNPEKIFQESSLILFMIFS